jgi:assimilatory nitrate reductase catalytic subunit
MTIDALDPLSRMPEFKVCAVRVERGTDIDPVPTPPVPPGEEPYGPEVRPLAERRSPTMPQGRGTSES